MENCIFCKIVKGDIPNNKVYEDDWVLAFHDISPKAPIHVIVIPKKHVANILELSRDEALTVAVTKAVAAIAQKLGVTRNGFRLVANTGHDGAQSVDHFHYHILAGKVFGESFG